MSIEDSPDFVSKQVSLSRYLFLDMAPAASERFVLTCAGREECSIDYELERKGFEYYAVEFVISGKLLLEHGGAVYECGPGTVFAYRPDSEFKLKAIGAEPLVKYFVDFTGKEAAAELRGSGLDACQPLLVLPTRWVQMQFDQILDCNRYPKPVAQEMCTMYTRLLLMRICQDARPHSLPNKDSFETYLRCRDYIRENYKTLMSMQELSEACHLDRAYLSRLYKKHGGERPYQFLVRLKMESAAEQLRNSNLSVKLAAAEVGYEDPFHFSRVFKKTFGLSPQKFVRR